MDQFVLKLTQHRTELNWLRHDIETLQGQTYYPLTRKHGWIISH